MADQVTRIMGLDLGSKTVGVAISDALGLTAQGKEIIRRERENKLRRTFARIEALIAEEGIGLVVLGLPLNMDGSVSARAKISMDFKDKLERRTGLPVILQDERLTTVEADDIMDRLEIPRSKRKEYVDMIAAEVILQEYLDTQGSGQNASGNSKEADRE